MSVGLRLGLYAECVDEQLASTHSSRGLTGVFGNLLAILARFASHQHLRMM